MVREALEPWLWGGYTLLALIGLVVLIFLYSYLVVDVECSGLKPECPQGTYCSVDFTCRAFPTSATSSVQEIYEKEYSLFPGVLFFLVFLAAAWLILRRGAHGKL